MKKIFLHLTCMIFAFSMATACASTGNGGVKITESSLLHHNFRLESVNGKPYNLQEPAPTIAFNEGMLVSGQICNRFNGQGKLAQGMLTVVNMASTRKLCYEPELNQYETMISQMLMSGVALDYDGQTLVMRQGGNELVYRLRDYVN